MVLNEVSRHLNIAELTRHRDSPSTVTMRAHSAKRSTQLRARPTWMDAGSVTGEGGSAHLPSTLALAPGDVCRRANIEGMHEQDLQAELEGSQARVGCFICMSCSGRPNTVLDEPLRSSPSVGAVIAGAGPLGVGYVLIVPVDHVGDIASALRQCPGFRDFVEHSLAEYESLFGSYTTWEHGSPTPGLHTSGCVTHAHLNVVPRLPLSAPPSALTASGWQDFAERASAPYLLLGGNGEPLQFGPDSGISQHYRREWARYVGEEDLWDYALGGIPDLQKQTVSRYVARL
jgi:hypothetical protein